MGEEEKGYGCRSVGRMKSFRISIEVSSVYEGETLGRERGRGVRADD